MSQQPLVEQLEHRTLYAVTPNDSGFASQENLRPLYVSKAWERTTGSMNTVIAAIDTGIDYTHPDLYANIWINQGEIPADLKRLIRDVDGDKRITFYDLNSKKNASLMNDVNANGIIDAGDLLTRRRSGGWVDGVNGVGFLGDTYVDDIIGWDFANNDNNPFDYSGAGTQSAGVMAAQTNNGRGISGISWQASVMPLKIFTDAGIFASIAKAGQAIKYAANAGARVSNNGWELASDGLSTIEPIYNAIKYAAAKGHVVVASATGTSANSQFFASMPGNIPDEAVISVASAANLGGIFATAGTNAVDVAAPGANILTTTRRGTYAFVTDANLATAHVTGAVALMLSLYPNLTAAEIKSDILATANYDQSFQQVIRSDGQVDVADMVYLAAVRRTLARGGDPGLQTVLVNGNTVTASGFTRHLYNILVANDPNYDPNGPV